MNIRFEEELKSWKKIGFLNPKDITEEDAKSLPVRYGTRTVVLTKDNKVVLIKIASEKTYTLVGGNIEDGESVEDGMIRECKEESGYDVVQVSTLGYIELWKKDYRRFVFGFLAKTVGYQGYLSLTSEEIELGHEVYECSIDEAIFLLEGNKDNGGNMASLRSLMFLREAKKYLDNMVK